MRTAAADRGEPTEERSMTHHYSVSEHVIFSEKGLSGMIWSGEYEINGLLAGDDENPQYQLMVSERSGP